MPYESGPDETLSPDEAHAWYVIERSLRRDLPLQRMERRARLRADRPIVFAALGGVGGLGLALMAGLFPTALTATGTMVAGACLGIILVRATLCLLSARRHPRRHTPWSTR